MGEIAYVDKEFRRACRGAICRLSLSLPLSTLTFQWKVSPFLILPAALYVGSTRKLEA